MFGKSILQNPNTRFGNSNLAIVVYLEFGIWYLDIFFYLSDVFWHKKQAVQH